MAEYRIVRDRYRGFEVQTRNWLGVWKQPSTNTHYTIEEAEKWAHEHATVIVKYLGHLPAPVEDPRP